MPNNWKTYKLSEVTTKIGSGATPRGGKEAYKDSGISLIRSQNVLDFNFSTDGLAFIDEEQASKLNNVTIEENDVLLNITGDSVARVCSVPKRFLPARVNQHVAIVRADDEHLDSNYLKYSLLENSNKSLLLTYASAGATRNALTKSMIENFELNLPPLPEQKAIANILSAIDDKIENNLATNKTLEDMAMALYKHWFVDFGPFQDGEFVETEIFGYNEIIEIPKSFQIISVKDSIIRLKQKNKYNQKNVLQYGNVRVFDQSTDRILGFHDNSPDFNADFEDPILIFGDHTCRFEIVCEDFSVGPNLIPFKPKEKLHNFIMYLGLKEKVITNDYKRHWSELMLHQLVVPNDEEVLNSFNKIIQENYSMINQNEFENLYLTKLRNTLLPKLISGEVRLREFRNQVETII